MSQHQRGFLSDRPAVHLTGAACNSLCRRGPGGLNESAPDGAGGLKNARGTLAASFASHDGRKGINP